MKSIPPVLALIILFFAGYVPAQDQQESEKSTYKYERTITINVRLEGTMVNPGSVISLDYSPIEYMGHLTWKSELKKQERGLIKYTFNTTEPVYVRINNLLKNKSHVWFSEPGDQVTITSDGEKLQFSGTGSEKFRLKYQLDSLRTAIPVPSNRRDYRTNSLADYFEWYAYLNNHLERAVPLIDSYKDKISDYAFHLIKSTYLDQNIDDRGDKFSSLLIYAKAAGIPLKTVCAIYDSTYQPVAEKWFPYISSRLYGNLGPIVNPIFREYQFDKEKEPLKSKFQLFVYEKALATYKGVIREKFILDYFPEILMPKLGLIPEIEKLLDQYYAEPGYPEYKQYMKKLELAARERANQRNAPDFTLFDAKDHPFKKKNISGKVAVLNFWFTDCGECAPAVSILRQVENKFRNDTNVVFLNISVDKDKALWTRSIAEKKYTTGGGINLYTGGEGESHVMIRQYAVNEYPAIWVMDPQGRIIKVASEPDLRKDNGKALVELLQRQLALPKDGPYVMHGPAASTTYFIGKSGLSKSQFNKGALLDLAVQTDLDKTFAVSIKKSLNPEACEYNPAERLLVLSDIEGNFDALRKLLQANKVIDNEYNWIFGNGHLVFVGDMFDRGLQVTECLWLFYSLEEKAKAAGGYVHFILGNHEIMNLHGDHRYVQQKYKDNALKTGRTLAELYGEGSELGKWLRTKNIIEKIGDLLFVHGGISPQVFRLPLTIGEINNLVRPYYSRKIDSTNQYLSILFDSRRTKNENSYPSPFWFRGYYANADNAKEIPSMKQLDSTLNKYKVRRIITGHTIVADTVSLHYEGKVINTDTHHAEGKSEALLIEGNRYYRVNGEGNKVLLFAEDKEGQLKGENAARQTGNSSK